MGLQRSEDRWRVLYILASCSLACESAGLEGGWPGHFQLLSRHIV